MFKSDIFHIEKKFKRYSALHLVAMALKDFLETWMKIKQYEIFKPYISKPS